MTATTKIDPATVEVIRHYFVSAATEMERTLVRTAYTTIIYEINDFGISLFDRNFNLIADSTGLPLFLGANEFAIRKSLEHTRSDPLEPGDVLFMNVPYWTGAHSNDGVLIAPAFVDGEIVAYGVIRAHWTDIGGKDPGYNLDTRSIHQEGLMIPGEKIVRRGEPNAELLRVLQANSRSPVTLLGDFNAEVAALRVGTRRIVELNEKYGVETVQAAVDRVMELGEAQARKATQALPDGEWEAENWIDNDGITDELIRVHVKVTKNSDAMEFDFSGSSDAVA
ncbi:MAG: hydantoinase B/oxoprolinase family protein, partial [Methyloligellaceae bacterium]